MHIGLLTTSFPRHPGDVAGDFVLGFARALAQRGHSFEVLAPEPAQRLPKPAWPGIELCWVPYFWPRGAQRTFYGAGVPDNLRRDPRAWLGPLPFCAALLRAAAARRARWDALVSHWALPCGLLAGALRQQRPHLAVLHSADLHLLARLPGRARLAADIARGASQLLFVSAQQRERFVGWLGPGLAPAARARSRVHPMGIDGAARIRAPRALERRRLGLERFTLLSIGRLVPVKGLVEAVGALRARGDLEWLIAGEGPERARLERLARGARLRVRLLGTVTGARKQALLGAADAFVLPSRVLASGRSEGVPTALLEAMAAGLPAVAADVGGVPEVLRHQHSGLLFDPRAPGALEAAIDRLLAAPELARALGARGAEQGARHHWSALAPELERLLR